MHDHREDLFTSLGLGQQIPPHQKGIARARVLRDFSNHENPELNQATAPGKASPAGQTQPCMDKLGLRGVQLDMPVESECRRIITLDPLPHVGRLAQRRTGWRDNQSARQGLDSPLGSEHHH